MADSKQFGQRDWVRSVLERFEGPLIRYAQRITGDVERARDVVQDTFLKLCRENQAHLDGHLSEWLFTVCRNQALDVLRKERRMSTIAVTELEKSESRDTPPADIAEQHDSAEQIQSLMAELPDSQQEVIRLKFHDGLSYREISQVTGFSVSNVGFLIHRGITTIRARVKSPDE